VTTPGPEAEEAGESETPAAWALVVDGSLEEGNTSLPRLQAAGLLGAVEEGGRSWWYFPEPVRGLPLHGHWEPVLDVDWSRAWREHTEPVTVGPLTVAPPWHAEPGPRTIVIEPGQAFGTGHHETTAGCLAALAELDLAGRSLLDAGTGSGILAIAAARLGAGEVVGCDLDPVAVAVARENIASNGVAVTVLEGDVAVLGDRRFDIVVANLDTSALVWAGTALVRRLADGGTLLASGVSPERSEEAVAAFAHAGLEVTAHPGPEWVLLTGRL
jgi:ribosomal protein L11 methyltransferase